MDKSYYIEYFDLERNNWWFRARLQIIRSQVALIANGRKDLNILNVGVATGATSVMLQEFGKVKSIEYDADCLAFVKERLDLDLEQGSIMELRFEDNTYDLVCAFDVIEHVENDQLAAHEMLRVCKPKGNVLVTVPAFMFLWSHHDVVNQHFRRYTLKGLNTLFHGHTILYSTYINTLLFIPISLVRFLSKLIPFKREGSGSDFGLIQNKFLNGMFYTTFISENALLRKKISLPFGVSALTSIMKNN
ncbi:MAG: methyltransferase domain-containing protein [Bacteroidia bacterium]|jgi:2-polyprenyl-3-methyl-5-hydroxy-6-metoxy-1,4-benzoquinol methylase